MPNIAPLAPTLTEPPDNSIQVASDIWCAWTHNDPGDPQSMASLRFKVPAGAWVSGYNVVGSAAGYNLGAAAPLSPGVLYEWQVQTRDSIDQPSPWSASRFFNTVAAVPQPTITTPAAGTTITSSTMPVAWAVPSGWYQDRYQVMVLQTAAPGAKYSDTGVVRSTVSSATVDVPTLPGVAMFISLVVWYANTGMGGSVTRSFTNAVLPPEVPLLVLAQTPGRPEVVVSVTNPAPSDANHLATATWDLRRDGVRIVRDLPPNTSFTDRMVGAGIVEFTVTARTANGGTAVSY